MTDPPPYSTPRWVKILGITALVLILLLGILYLSGVSGKHGPDRHLPSDDADGTPQVSIIIGAPSFAGGSAGDLLLLGHRMNKL
jgi:hypothetical protein